MSKETLSHYAVVSGRWENAADPVKSKVSQSVPFSGELSVELRWLGGLCVFWVFDGDVCVQLGRVVLLVRH